MTVAQTSTMMGVLARVRLYSIILDCNSMCTACTGPTNLECSACSGSNKFISGTTYCLAWCPSNMYDNGGTCTNCPTECDNCTGGTAADCIRCK